MFESSFMRVALLASIATSAPLSAIGVYLIIRRVAFLGLVLANAAAVGAAVAQSIGWPAEMASVMAAVAAALGLGMMPTPRRASSEAVIGWAYAAASSATVLILARTAAADADTLHLLYGNVLAVSPDHAAALVVIALIVGVVHALFGPRFLLLTFDAEAAEVAGVHTRLWSLGLNLSIGVAAAAAVHEIGALLTFSLLTLAPTASLLITRRIATTFVVSAAIGMTAVCVGLVASFQLDLPPGPASVATLVLMVPAAALFSRRQG